MAMGDFVIYDAFVPITESREAWAVVVKLS